MKITDVIRSVLDLIDGAGCSAPEPVVAVVATEPNHTDDGELLRMRQIAGLVSDEAGEYTNSPVEKYAGIDAVTAAGDDVHKSKHPADIRGNSISMYQGQ